MRVKPNIYILLPVIAILLAILGVFFVVVFLFPQNSSEKRQDIKESISVKKEAYSKTSPKETFFEETNYKGNLSAYPILYELPFQKTKEYVSNKELNKLISSESLDECVMDATSFMESLCNVNYQKIATNKDAFVSDVMIYADYEAYHTQHFGTEEEKTEYLFEYIEGIADYYIKNQVEVEAKFLTDTSLVYKDNFIFVRGILIFTIYSNLDANSEYQIGTSYEIPMEVAMHKTPANPEDISIVSFGLVSDNNFYKNP